MFETQNLFHLLRSLALGEPSVKRFRFKTLRYRCRHQGLSSGHSPLPDPACALKKARRCGPLVTAASGVCYLSKWTRRLARV